MAFPLEPYKLVSFLKAFSVATSDADTESSAIIKPLPIETSTDSIYGDMTPEDALQYSPPIPYDLPSFASQHIAPQPKKTTVKHKKVRSPKHQITESPKSISNDNQLLPLANEERYSTSAHSVTTLSDATPKQAGNQKRNYSKTKNPLSKLFHKAEKLQLPSQSPSNSASDRITIKSNTVLSSPSNSYGITSGRQIFSAGSGPPNADSNAENVLENYASEKFGHSIDGQSSDFGEDSEDEEEENGENMTNSISSSDSNFTDIEGDSMLDINSSMYKYSVGDSYLLRDPEEVKNHSRKESGAQTLNTPAASIPTASRKNSSTAVGVINRSKGGSNFSFEKNYDAVGKPHNVQTSNLSRMIQSRFKSTSSNPLSFYSFVGSESDVAKAAKVKVDIFVPPKTTPVIEKLEFWNSAAVHEVIGFILLNLSEMPEYAEEKDVAFLNPNHWRLELIDEDGELYDGNFGHLDRTRQLASYNSPSCLALCRVEKKQDIANNEKLTPLAPDFKHNLKMYQSKPQSTSFQDDQQPRIESMANGDTTEVKVGNIPDDNTHMYVSFFINATMTVSQLLDLICQQYHVDASRYRLAEAEDPNNKGTMLGDALDGNSWQKPLDNASILSNLATNKFKFVPNISQLVRPMTDVQVDNNHVTDVGITPSTPFISSHGITPPQGRLQNDSSKTSQPEPKSAPPKNTLRKKLPSVKHFNENKGGLTFGDILNQNRPQLPANLNTIYFKWTVFRRKPPLLNRIEKSLIIDGDYIHLAPTDDATWSKTPHESAFSTSNVHHHHHLHHYNYSKFYNDTMMKTSSFHISQIVKLKQYTQSKNPNHFKIVINKPVEESKEPYVKKKYDLEAANVAQCEEIVEKIEWTMQVYDNMIEK